MPSPDILGNTCCLVPLVVGLIIMALLSLDDAIGGLVLFIRELKHSRKDGG